MSEPNADCLFCKIAAGEIPSTEVYSDEDVYAFRDLQPQAPTHVLVVPRKHYADVAELSTDTETAAAVLRGVAAVAKSESLGAGFRTVFNSGPDAHQTVFHVHAHVLGRRTMGWPPG